MRFTRDQEKRKIRDEDNSRGSMPDQVVWLCGV